VRRLKGRIFQCQGDNPRGDLVSQSIGPRGPRLVAKKAVEAFLPEPPPPAPDAGLGESSKMQIFTVQGTSQNAFLPQFSTQIKLIYKE
jgi:hypothetical protein